MVIVVVVVVVVVLVVVVVVIVVVVLQEPGANGMEILNGVKHVRPGRGFVPNFHLTEKIDVNGRHEHALYTYLKVKFASLI
ncbi:glutathione peroxidase [Elysia marginata]|uniref:Glutathione peroxidase n=1 Tax=Elysia marginata TaxID=1093978 RepID=A0AAV4FFD3_9GAST|nr:glutathione peroxidase [Elysia marginata]